MSTAESTPIDLLAGDRAILRKDLAKRMGSIAETIDHTEDRGGDLTTDVVRLRTAVTLMELALGERDELPSGDIEARPLIALLVELRNEALVYHTYEDGDQEDLIEWHQAGVFASIVDQLEGSRKAVAA
jgi:hypothetical protein